MLAAVFLVATTIGGFAFESSVCERTKSVSSAPPGYAATWTESITAIGPTDASDADLSRLMRDHADRLRQQYYEQFSHEHASFETHDHAGSLDFAETVIAASPDIISVRVGARVYEAGASHSDSLGTLNLTWSRGLHRLLTEADVFAVPPDRALRLLALEAFDNPQGLQNPDDPDGVPLPWHRASIGPKGITWLFESYELGGYASGGTATIGWSALQPYLRSDLPFVIDEIHEASDVARRQGQATCG